MSEPIPSATVVLLRTAENDVEVLLLKRNSKISYGGAWVFPGGKLDPADYGNQIADQSPVAETANPHCDVMLAAAKHAAYRETQEEAGIVVEKDQLVFFSHWTTPIIRPKRFSTWFFIAPAEEHEVTIDGGEIHAHSWKSPVEALRAHKAGEIELVPPTYLTLLELSRYRTVDAAIAAFAAPAPELFEPRVEMLPSGSCYLYHGDAGYEESDHTVEGARHRLYANQNRDWMYERTSNG